MNAPAGVLFLGHGAERSGPPVFLAGFEQWLTANTEVPITTVLARGGDLVDDYRRAGAVRVVDRHWTVPRVLQQGLVRLGRTGTADAIRARRVRAALRASRATPLVYVNTVAPATVQLLDQVDWPATVVVHVHELDAALRYRLTDDERRRVLGRPDLVVAASQAVADNLTENHGVDPARVRVHHEFVVPIDPISVEERARRRHQVGLPEDAFVVGGSGMTEWRKGPDLFVRAAAAFRARSDRDVRFVWVGGADRGPEWAPLDHEARHLGVDDVVRFVGQQERSGDWYRLFDVFALTSREDAFPLSALEAATAGVPVVTFDTGGMVEFVGPIDASAIVAYDDIDAFATVLVALAEDDDRCRRIGQAAADRARTHHTVEVAAGALWADLEPLSKPS